MGFFYTNRKSQQDQSQTGQQLSSSLLFSCNDLLRLIPWACLTVYEPFALYPEIFSLHFKVTCLLFQNILFTWRTLCMCTMHLITPNPCPTPLWNPSNMSSSNFRCSFHSLLSSTRVVHMCTRAWTTWGGVLKKTDFPPASSLQLTKLLS